MNGNELSREKELITPETNLGEIMRLGLEVQERKLDDVLNELDLARAEEKHHRTFRAEFKARVDAGVFSDVDALSKSLGVTEGRAPETLEEAWDFGPYRTEFPEVGVYLHERFELNPFDALAILSNPNCKKRILDLMRYLHNYRTALALESTLGKDSSEEPDEKRRADFAMLELRLVREIGENIGEIGSFVAEQKTAERGGKIPEPDLTRGEVKILDFLSKGLIQPWDAIDKELKE